MFVPEAAAVWASRGAARRFTGARLRSQRAVHAVGGRTWGAVFGVLIRGALWFEQKKQCPQPALHYWFFGFASVRVGFDARGNIRVSSRVPSGMVRKPSSAIGDKNGEIVHFSSCLSSSPLLVNFCRFPWMTSGLQFFHDCKTSYSIQRKITC